MGNQSSAANGQQPATAGSGSGPAAGSSSSNVNYTSVQSNGTGTATQARKGPLTPVILNVYEPSKPQSSMPGFGIYHTGIEFKGVEYAFAGSPNAGAGTGVQSQVPRAMPEGGQWKFKQSIELGTVSATGREFDKMLEELKAAFPANTYDLIHRNCSHFTAAVAKRLGLSDKYPAWVNRAASWGAAFSAPPKNHKPLDELLPPPKESIFKTSTGHRLGDSTSTQPTSAKKTEQKKQDDKKTATSSARKNPWANPDFIPPQMRKDPVVNGVAKAAE